jgi:hypothetical protein
VSKLSLTEAPRHPLATGIDDLVARLEAVEAKLAALADHKPEPPLKTGGLTKKELAAALTISTSTIDRLDRTGAPHWYCGDQRRYDLVAYREWCAGRGKKAPSTEVSR